MVVNIHLYGWVSRVIDYDQSGSVSSTLMLPAGSTIADVLTSLGIPVKYPLLFLLNGEKVTANAVLCHQDKLEITVLIGGG